MNDQERDRPLPHIDLEEWNRLKSDANCVIDFSDWVNENKVPLHESLLLDAELVSETDSRVAILYAALACDVFIQSWLEHGAIGDSRNKKWLEWANPRSGSEGNVSIRGFYDIGLQLAEGRSLKDQRQLWKEFGTLVKARNDVAHRGLHSPRYSTSKGIETARKVIDWVEQGP